MSVPTRRILEPIYGEASLASANNGGVNWARGLVSPLDQKGPTGWLACLYGGVQTGDDWARVNIPVFEQRVPDFNYAQWSYYMTATQTMGVGIVIWVHDPNDFDKRAEITQLGSTVEKTSGWDASEFTSATTGMLFYGEGTTGTGLTAGTQYTWAQFQEDALFSTWTIYRITFDYGWEASGTFSDVWVADIKLNGMPIFLRPDSRGTGRIANRYLDVDTGALALTLAPKTPFRLVSIGVHASAVLDTGEALTATMDALAGIHFDRVILTDDLFVGSRTSETYVFGKGYDFQAGDEIDFAQANGSNDDIGLVVTYQTVFD